MLLHALRIKNLFGSFSYDIQFDDTKNPLLLTGPNGYGKTTLLTILYNLSQANLFYFYQLPFEEIRLTLDNNQSLIISSATDEQEKDLQEGDQKLFSEKQIEFIWMLENKVVSTFILNKRLIDKAIRQIGYYKGTLLNEYDLMSETFLEFANKNSRFYELLAKDQGQAQFLMLLNSIPTIFIQSQRLFFTKNSSGEQSSSIEQIVYNLREKINKDYFNFLKVSQQKDNTFIDTLLSSQKEYTESEYRELLKKLTPLIKELQSFGLIKSIKIRDYEPDKARILSVYLDDLHEKLKVYSNIQEKLRLLSTLLSRKKFANKSITLSPEHGLRIKTESGKFLDVNKLSSGEQNEIILLYNLIFEVADRTLLLIDEPENSLHVAWQQEFINDISDIVKSKDIQIIIATHSPHIIGGRWQESFDLYEKNLNQ